MQLKVNCTACGHERALDGIDANELPLGVLMLNTHSCECTEKCENCANANKCEDCEDMQIYKETVARLRQEVTKLHLKLRGVQLAHE